MKSRLPVFVLLASLFPIASGSLYAQSDSSERDEPAAKEQVVLGWVQNIRLLPDRMLMKAKLDSGAKSNAIHAEDIEEYMEDGKEMVRFKILKDHDDAGGESITVERPLVREVNIKIRNTDVRESRLAVRLEFCLAGEIYNTVFTLANRSNFNYPVLLGRDFLKNKILVDSSESFTHRVECPRS
ncbi:MAG: RimK/LysX family protein [Pseudomonadota bacterium]